MKKIYIIFFISLSILLVKFWGFNNTLKLDRLYVTNYVYGERVYIDSLDVFSTKEFILDEDNTYFIIENNLPYSGNYSFKVSKIILRKDRIRIILDKGGNLIHSNELDKNDTLKYFYQTDSVQRKWLRNYLVNDFELSIKINDKFFQIHSNKSSEINIKVINFVKF